MTKRMFEKRIVDIVRRNDKQAKVWLFGSRARGDNRKDSDRDVLILLDKDAVTEADHERIAFPLYDLGIDNDTIVSPKLYTVAEWERRSFTPFYKNVVNDRKQLL